MKLKNRKITVVGSARSGLAAAKFLSNQGAIVTIIDKNKSIKTTKNIEKLIKLGVKFKTGDHVLSDFKKAQLVVLSPGVPHTIPPIRAAVKCGIPIIGEVELASNFINKPIIAVTGTNGKTTTVKLIEKMLIDSSKKVFLGGNTGIPLTECLYKLDNIEVVIAEISSFQLDTIKKFQPTTSVLLNIANDHMDRYSSFNDYANSKLKIFSNQTMNNVAVFNITDETTRKLTTSSKLRSEQRPFSKRQIENGAQIFDDSIIIFNKKIPMLRFDLTKSKLQGFHNRENIAAASLAALSEGASAVGIQSAIDSFEKPPHRIETIKYFRGVRFVNDSKATNVNAVISALKCFNTPIILILGGQSKNVDFRLLKPHLSKKVKFIIAIGEARNEIKLALASLSRKKHLVTTRTMENAIKKATESAQVGDTVLLSPGCTSFDQFKNYEHRGLKFKKLVEKLI